MSEEKLDPRAKFEALQSLPPADLERVRFVKRYVDAGADVGLGKFEWDTIKAVLTQASLR